MLGLGAVLAFFGLGSAVLHFTDVQFRLFMWAEEWQPALGLVVGGVGAVFLLIATLRGNDDPPQAQQGAYGQPPATPQAGFGQPAYAPPGPGHGSGSGYGPPPPGHHGGPQGGYPPPGFGGPAIPQQGPQYGPPPPQDLPPPRGPVQDFGPQGGPPFGPRGR